MNQRSLAAGLSLLVPVLLSLPACSNEDPLRPSPRAERVSDQGAGPHPLASHAPDGPGHRDAVATITIEDITFEELLPARVDVFVVKVAPGVEPEQIALALGAEVLRILPGDLVVLAGIHSPESQLDATEGILAYEPNQSVGLAFGQDLTLGFYEGHQFGFEDLQGNEKAFAPLELETIHRSTRGSGIRIGVVDTGADPDHPLLAGRVTEPLAQGPVLWTEQANGIDDDEDGEIDEAHGHGSFVAGIIAQVAPRAEIVPVRALEADGVGSLADVITAIQLLVANDVDVVNLSLSLSAPSLLLEEMIGRMRAMGIAVVAASGNQGTVTAYPARLPNVIGVAALDREGVLAAFSNSGPDCELAAPGVALLSAYPDDRLANGDGTSFAAPIVSAAIALVLASPEADRIVGANPFAVGAGLALLNQADPLQPLLHGRLQTAWLADGSPRPTSAHHATKP